MPDLSQKITLGCAFFQASYYLKEDILSSLIEISGGRFVVPEGPGLGSTPDMEKLAYYAQS